MSDAAPNNDWNPLDPETLCDPHATYADLRARCPVAHSDEWGGFWALFKYEDIVAATGDPRTFINSVQNVVPKVFASGKRIPLHFDPPAHTHYRRALNAPFDPERIAAFEPNVRQIAARLLQPLLAKNRGDVVREFTYHFPVLVLCAFLGIPESDAMLLKETGDRFVRALHESDKATLESESARLYAYARQLVAARKKTPLDPERDVASALLAARIDGKPIDEETIVGGLRQLLVAGHLAPTFAIGSAIMHLAAHADLQARLRRDPARIPDAVEEFLRLSSPTQAFARTVTRDVEIKGRTIKPGEPVAMVWISANRDADIFPNPDEFDLDRRPNKHLAFGHGIHKCLGAPLARLEIRVAIEELLARTKEFALDGTVTLTEWPEYGPKSLPVRFMA